MQATSGSSRTILRLIAAFLLLASFAYADTIYVWDPRLPGNHDRGMLGLNIIEAPEGQPPSTVSAFYVGVLGITLTDDNGKTYDRDTLCVDLFTDINITTYYNTVVLHPDQVANKHIGRVSWLVDNALLPTQNNVYTSVLPEEDWVMTPEQGAAIQLAIWDIVHDGGDGLSSGSVQFDRTVNTVVDDWAATYFSASLGKSSDLAFVYRNFNGSGVEAQMLAGPMFSDDGPHPNPEPRTFVLAGAALLALGHIARKKRK